MNALPPGACKRPTHLVRARARPPRRQHHVRQVRIEARDSRNVYDDHARSDLMLRMAFDLVDLFAGIGMDLLPQRV